MVFHGKNTPNSKQMKPLAFGLRVDKNSDFSTYKSINKYASISTHCHFIANHDALTISLGSPLSKKYLQDSN
jgi:hypothetical protein